MVFASTRCLSLSPEIWGSNGDLPYKIVSRITEVMDKSSVSAVLICTGTGLILGVAATFLNLCMKGLGSNLIIKT